jgi:hypothetical protein
MTASATSSVRSQCPAGKCCMSGVGPFASFEASNNDVAITLNADIRLRCNICRNGPKGDILGSGSQSM